MALFDFLKRKKEVEKARSASSGQAKESKKPEKKAGNVSAVEKTEKKETPVVEAKASLRGQGFSYQIIKEPHISEKATYLAEENKYTFKIYSNANKPEIKKSVEGIYGVNVTSVKVIHIPHKKRRLGKTEGFKKAYRKAVVTIKEGQKIEIF